MNKLLFSLLFIFSITQGYLGTTYNPYSYNDGLGYMIRRCGDTDYVSGPCGYFATGRQCGDTYYYNEWN